KPYAPVVDRILKDVVSLLQRAVKDEEQYLDEIKANRRNLLRRKRDVNKVERAIVIEVFRQWHTNLKPLPPGSTLTIRILNSFLPHIALGFIRREMFRNVYSGPLDFSLGAALDNSDRAFTMDDNADPEYLGGLVYDEPKGEISRTIKWVVSFTRYRRELLTELDKVNDSHAVLLTPALLDLTKWLNARETPVSISKQVAIMSRLSRERPKNLPLIHGFVPFDPLRQAIHDKVDGPITGSPFAIVKKAIMEQGLIGVKLYPPMGFRASGNA